MWKRHRRPSISAHGLCIGPPPDYVGTSRTFPNRVLAEPLTEPELRETCEAQPIFAARPLDRQDAAYREVAEVVAATVIYWL